MRAPFKKSFPGAKIRQSSVYQAACALCSTLQKHGHEAYFVGGAVRDFFLEPNRVPTDIDIATSALAEEVMCLFPGSNYVGREFGVVLVKHRGVQMRGRIREKTETPWFVFEVTTFRCEGKYSDRRHPDSVHLGTREEDSRRRDFTWNALYFDPVSRALQDSHGGRADLAARRVRAVGCAFDRFYEDSLRILRMCRFAAGFHMCVERETEAGARRAADGLASLSRERIVVEIRKVRSGKFVEFLSHLWSVVSPRDLDPSLPLASFAVDWRSRLPRQVTESMGKGFYKEMPLLALAIVTSLVAGGLAVYWPWATGLELWPLTRAEQRVLRASNDLFGAVGKMGVLEDVALHTFLEKMLDLSVRDVAMILTFVAVLLEEKGGACLLMAEALSAEADVECLFRSWWRAAVVRYVAPTYRSDLALEVRAQGLSPSLIRVACALIEVPVMRAALGLGEFALAPWSEWVQRADDSFRMERS